jgi:hypothetical protein
MTSKAEELLTAFVTGTATPLETRQVEEAARNDEGFRAKLESARALNAMFEAVPAEKPSAGFADRVVAAARSRTSSRVEDYFTPPAPWYTNVFRSRKIVISVAIHAAVLAILAFVVLKPDTGTQFPPVVEITARGTEAVVERVNAPRSSSSVVSGAVDVSSLGMKGIYHIVVGEESRRRMVIAFTPEELKKQPEHHRNTATPVFVRDGKLRLPSYLAEENLFVAKEVVVLKLTDRVEIWRSEDFGSYLNENRFALPPDALI